VVDHSLHFLETKGKELSLLLTGILNSTPARTYAATYVNRTGAAYCQYFGWIISLVPIPIEVINLRARSLLNMIEKIQVQEEFSTEVLASLDRIVSELYGIDSYLDSMKDFLDFFSTG